MYQKNDKRYLYQLISMFLRGEISPSSFCDSFYYSYDLGNIDQSTISALEKENFDHIKTATDRFSPYENDHTIAPKAFCTEEELYNRVKDAWHILDGNKRMLEIRAEEERDKHFCRVCGLYIDDKPWGDDNKTPTHDICPCCGVEFGNEDFCLASLKEYRKQWIEKGAKWWDEENPTNSPHTTKPFNWKVEEQMTHIPKL